MSGSVTGIAEFAGGGLAEDDETARAQPGHRPVVDRRQEEAPAARAEPRERSSGEVQVLHRDGDAEERRPGGVGIARQRGVLAPGVAQRAPGEHLREGVERAVHPLDPREVAAHELFRRDLPRADEPRLLQRRPIEDVRARHRPDPLREGAEKQPPPARSGRPVVSPARMRPRVALLLPVIGSAPHAATGGRAARRTTRAMRHVAILVVSLGVVAAAEQPAHAKARAVRIEGSGIPGCVRPGWIADELGRRVTHTGDERVQLFLRGDGRLQVSLHRGGALVASRSLPARRDDCAAIERTAVLVLASWWNLPIPAAEPQAEARTEAQTVPQPSAPTPPPRPAPPGLPVAPSPQAQGASPSPSPPVAAREPSPPSPPAPPEGDGTAREGPSGIPNDAPSPAAVAEAAQEASPPLVDAIPPRAAPVGVSVVARAQGHYDGVGGFGGHAVLEAGAARGAAGFAEVGLERTRTAALGPGEVRVSPAFAGVGVRWAVPRERVQLGAGVGARIYRLSATARGFDTDGSTALLSPAALAQIEVRLPLGGALFGSFALQGWTRLREERLSVQGLGVAHAVKPVGVGLAAGLGWGGE
jgi:hypothetical protein